MSSLFAYTLYTAVKVVQISLTLATFSVIAAIIEYQMHSFICHIQYFSLSVMIYNTPVGKKRVYYIWCFKCTYTGVNTFKHKLAGLVIN